jgi:hypothetical protein
LRANTSPDDAPYRLNNPAKLQQNPFMFNVAKLRRE